MYVIRDNFGTYQTAWTMKEALEWFAVASPEYAVLRNWITGRILYIRGNGIIIGR